MTLHVKDATGTFREITDLQVRDSGGALREIQEGWVRDSGGNLRQFYSRGSVVLTGGVISDSNSPLAESRVRFNTDGSIDQYTATAGVYSQFHPGEWWSSEPQTGIGSSYQIQLASFTGFAASTGPAVGVWTPLSSAVEWTRQTSAGGTRNWNGVIEIRKGTGAVLASATITLRTVL
jgi:hypothetical protein